MCGGGRCGGVKWSYVDSTVYQSVCCGVKYVHRTHTVQRAHMPLPHSEYEASPTGPLYGASRADM